MTRHKPSPAETVARERELLAAIADVGDTGIYAPDLYKRTADLWPTRARMYVALANLARRRLVYQDGRRGPYLIPITVAR